MKSPFKTLFITLGVIILVAWVCAAILYIWLDVDVASARPWTIPQLLMDDRTGPIVMQRIQAIGAGVALMVIAAIGIKVLTDSEKPYGDARFATEKEIQKSNLRDKQGLVLGKKNGKFLVNDGQTHVLVTAPTGSGKGVGIVIPNLLSWNGSAVVLDVKGENCKITSGFRKSWGQNIVVFSPLSGATHRYNPFDQIKALPEERRLTSLQNMANTLLPDPERGEAVWAQQGRALFVGLSLYLLAAPDREATLGELLRHLQTEQETTEICKVIIADYRDILDPASIRALANFSQQEKKLAESVKLGLVGALSLWENPLVDAATSATDFDINALRREATTIYIVVGISDMRTLRPLIKLFIEQIYAAQLRSEPEADEPHKVLFLLDEFESLGTMTSVVDNLPFVRSYAVRMMLIIQGLTQLDQRYGEAGREKILQSSAHQIYFASNDMKTTQYISTRLGQKTIKSKSKSHSVGGNRSRSQSSMGRSLMMPQEVSRLPSAEQILLVEGQYPVKANKVRYYDDNAFKKRLGFNPVQAPEIKAVSKPSPIFETDVIDKATEEKIANMASDLDSFL